MRKRARIFKMFFMVFVVFASTAWSEETGQNARALTELSLERLLNVSVISASRKSQSLSDVTSAVFVINHEDIRRSGATNIPDLLRMVPGVQVASISGNSWAISIRGFNGNFANKLLVMIDGRSVYTPLYGGVFWDVQDTPLDNIDRIEIIRGSGGTMWGANAVNGVINIITKSPQDANGTFLTALSGSHERATVMARYGSTIGEDTSYRLHVQHTNRGNTFTESANASDSMQLTSGGFRINSTPTKRLNLNLQGELYGGEVNNTFTTVTPPTDETKSRGTKLFGGNILSRFDWLQSDSSKISLQLYYDRTNRNTAIFNEKRDTVDMDLQYNIRLFENHEATLGVGYRFLHDRTTDTNKGFLLTPEERSDHLVNIFIQDEITLVPETLRFIIGSKFEHNDYTGWELQPSARLSWTPNKGYSFWAAVTRSVRTPSRAEQDVKINLAIIPPNHLLPLPTVITVTGDRQLKSETLLAYELGFRADVNEFLSLDISSYFNQYNDLISSKYGTPYLGGATLAVQPSNFSNMYKYQSCGAEISLNWQPLDWWKLKGGYAYTEFFGNGANESIAKYSTPLHQATIRSMMTFGRDFDFDLWTRYVGANISPLVTANTHIPAYITLDARLAWRPMAGVELSVVGKNLLERRHPEAVTFLTTARYEVERSVSGKISWEF